MDAGEAAATARRLRLNIAPLPQTEWCHHWADVLHNNRPPMWSLFQKIRSIRANRQTGFHVRLGTVVLLDVCARALRSLRVGFYVYVCMCLHLFIAAPPSSQWQFACLHFSHSYWALTEALLHKHRATSHHRCLCSMQKHTTKERESCSNKHTCTCGCRVFYFILDCKLLIWGVSLADTHLAWGIVC